MESGMVSVIVPVYNVQKYLNRCITSIMNQTYKNIEVIVIDDGSNDGSEILCGEYDSMSNFHVYHQNHAGVSVARNLAIQVAKGDYLLFVDADDYIAPDLLETTVMVMEKYQADLVTFNYYIDTGTNITQQSYDFNKYGSIKDEITTEQIIFFSLVDVIPIFLWNKLYRKELWSNLVFPKMWCYEDLFILPHIMLKVKHAVYIPDVLYYHNQSNLESLTSNKNNFAVKGRFEKYRAFIEHIKISHILGVTRAEQWSVEQALREAIKTLYIDYHSTSRLSTDEIKELRCFLHDKWEPALAHRLGHKLTFLRWCSLKHPILCKCYSCIRYYQEKVKSKL